MIRSQGRKRVGERREMRRESERKRKRKEEDGRAC